MSTRIIIQLIARLADLAFKEGREHERGWHSIARVTELKRRDMLREIKRELERVPDMSNRRTMEF